MLTLQYVIELLLEIYIYVSKFLPKLGVFQGHYHYSCLLNSHTAGTKNSTEKEAIIITL